MTDASAHRRIKHHEIHLRRLRSRQLNLFLHIVGRRPDGYHLLESVFMLIDWCDTLHFELRADGLISREDLSDVLPQEDLIVRAARALQQVSGTALGAHIAIDKRIPAQAGMGGGSSDAASTLLALNRLWKLNLELDSLLSIGLKLGADVPFSWEDTTHGSAGLARSCSQSVCRKRVLWWSSPPMAWKPGEFSHPF